MIFNSGSYNELSKKALSLIDREDGQSEPETALELLKQCLPKLDPKGEMNIIDSSSEESLEIQFVSDDIIKKANQ